MTPAYYTVAKVLAVNVGLLKALEEVFDEKRINTILALSAFYHQEKNAVRQFEQWCKERNYETNCLSSSQDISKFFKEISTKVEDFKEVWSKNRYYDGMSAIFDITSHSSYAETYKNNLVKRGYNCDSNDLPQMNFALIIDPETKIPVNFDLFNGNCNDISHFSRNIMRLLPNVKDPDIELVFDNGCCSQKALQTLSDENVKFTTVISEGSTLYKELVEKSYGNILLDGQLTYDRDVFSKRYDTDYLGVPVNAYVYFDYKLLIEEREALRNKTETLKEEAIKYLDDPKKLLSHYGSILKIKPHGDTTLTASDISVDEDKYYGLQKQCGFFALITNTPRDSLSVLKIYRGRNYVETMMHIIKNVLGFKTDSTHTSEDSIGKFFTAFTSLIIYSQFTIAVRKDPTLTAYSIEDMIKELNLIEVLKLKNNNFEVSVMSTLQKKLLNAVGISVDEFADEIKKNF
ncbi:IS1634 family transposase [Psittacicella hinzii]